MNNNVNVLIPIDRGFDLTLVGLHCVFRNQKTAKEFMTEPNLVLVDLDEWTAKDDQGQNVIQRRMHTVTRDSVYGQALLEADLVSEDDMKMGLITLHWAHMNGDWWGYKLGETEDGSPTSTLIEKDTPYEDMYRSKLPRTHPKYRPLPSRV